MNETTQATRAIIYARGVPEAIERQLNACREYATTCGFTVGAEVVEHKAASGAYAPHASKLLEQVDMHHPDVVIVTDLSRLSRKYSEFMALHQALTERHVNIVTLA